uniref:Uncharacterized protein n=1 Tax=Solanum tuberosum TaxID=4113 RepID=M1C8B4_SOLTU
MENLYILSGCDGYRFISCLYASPEYQRYPPFFLPFPVSLNITHKSTLTLLPLMFMVMCERLLMSSITISCL